MVLKDNSSENSSNLLYLDGQELWPFLKDVIFSEIVIEDSAFQPKDILALVLSSLNTNKITFKKPAPLSTLIPVTTWLHQ